MASSVPSYVNFRSFGTSGDLTRYADGSFLTVWTEFTATGAAYVYGKAFKADGTTLKDVFLIDTAPASAQASYSDVTAATLSDGRTVVAWVKSDGTQTIVGKVLSAGFVPSGGLLSLGDSEVTSQDAPQIHALQNGGFSVQYKGVEDGDQAQIASIVIEQNGQWTSEHYRLDGDDIDPQRSITLDSGKFVSFYAYANEGSTYVDADIVSLSDGIKTFPIDAIPGITEGITVTASPIGNDKFVVAWEDAEGAGRVIRAQIFDSGGTAIGAPITFTKPNGTLEGAPVIKQLATGGFAIAFTIDVGGDDENIYTAAATANGTIIANTTYVGTSTAGDQWDPSLIVLSGNNYAVSWMSDSETGPQYMVEVIGISGTSVPPPTTNPDNPGDPTQSTVWSGTDGNDARTGTSAAEVFKGLGGKDIIDGSGGNDILWGGLGNDNLKGGIGRDIFVFDTKPNKSSNKDKIADFKVSDDGIWLDNKVFTKLGKAGTEAKPVQLKKDFFTIGSKARDKNDYIVYDKGKGVLYYDADGSGKGKTVEIATLSKKLAMTHKDFYVI